MGFAITVYVPDNSGETALFAAEELKKFLQQLQLRQDISVDMSIDKLLHADAYHITGRACYRISAGGETGLLYGAYALLKAFGIEFFSPDKFDTYLPAIPVDAPAVNITFEPRFDLRGFFAVEKRDTEAFLLWMARHGLNYWSSATNHPELCRKLAMKLRANAPGGMHLMFQDYLPPEKYFAEHPEYYALRNGKRDCSMQPGDSCNICTSNSGAADTLVSNIIRDLQPGGRLEQASALSFAPFDNGHWCECPQCAMLGNRTARLLKLADYCSKRIRNEVKRPVTLIVPAYHETLSPPDVDLGKDFDFERIMIEFFPIERCYAHTIDDENCRCNLLLREFFEAWQQRGDFRLFICEYYNVSAFASVGLLLDDYMEHDLAYYAQSGAAAIAYMHVSTALWGQLALNNSAYAAAACGQMFDTANFMQKRFGEYAGRFTRIYDLLRRIGKASKPLLHYLGTGDMSSDHSNTVKYMLLVELRKALKGAPYQFYLPGHFENEKDNGAAISLKSAMKLLEECEHLIAAVPNQTCDELLTERIACEKMRFYYTSDRIRFTHDLLRLFEAETAGDTREAEMMAENVFRRGEKMRQDKIGPAHIRSKGAPNELMYFNALTATRFQQIYAEKMLQYGKKTAPFAAEENVEIKQG